MFLQLKIAKRKFLLYFWLLSKKKYFSFLGDLTARSIIFGGPILKADNLDILDLIIKEYNNTVRKNVIYSQFRNFWEQNNETKILKKHDFAYEQHLNILIDLTKSENILWTEMTKNRRKGIKRAKKLGAKPAVKPKAEKKENKEVKKTESKTKTVEKKK